MLQQQIVRRNNMSTSSGLAVEFGQAGQCRYMYTSLASRMV